MSEELIIEQPQTALWLNPGQRLGHLIAIFNVRSKEMQFDDLSGRDKEVAEFDFVDLDQEREQFSGIDNHPGVTKRLKIGNPAVILGRVAQVANRNAGQKDALVLTEHGPGDQDAFRNWFGAQNGNGPGPSSVQPVSSPVQTQAVASPNQTQVPSSVPVPSGGKVPELDLSTLPPETLALIMRAAQQQQGT